MLKQDRPGSNEDVSFFCVRLTWPGEEAGRGKNQRARLIYIRPALLNAAEMRRVERI